MKITHIEIIPIFPKLAKRYGNHKVRLNGIDHGVVYRVPTVNGLVGYGDLRILPGKAPDPSILAPLIGRDPFDFINNTFNGGLGGALYDVMGKYLEAPAYKLMGPKVRDVVSVAVWTRPASPEEFSKEIIRVVGEGYTIFKMHSCAYHDVIEQTKAAEEVAPEGFKIHWDFNSNRSVAAVCPLSGNWSGTIRSDVYMIRGSVGDALTRGFAYSRANIQTIMQHGAGTLGKAMALHRCAVLPSATGHMITLEDQYEEDYTRVRIPVDEGCSPVPEGPGLGYEVGEDGLARVAANDSFPNVTRLTGREEGTVRGIRSDLWEEDGLPVFEQVYERVQKEGAFSAYRGVQYVELVSTLTRRALLLGLAMSAWVNLWPAYASMIVRSSRADFAHLSVAFLIPFVFLLGLNLLLKRRACGLLPSELLTICCIDMVAANRQGEWLSGYVLGIISAPTYFVTPPNRWVELLLHHIPPWSIVAGWGATTRFYEGLPAGGAIPWAPGCLLSYSGEVSWERCCWPISA